MSFCVLAHLQKLMSDKKCSAEKKSEMDSVITQVHLILKRFLICTVMYSNTHLVVFVS